jgi:UDP-hydrolysing UDP-N-acetyl-D-glucosamine 2-epimerase
VKVILNAEHRRKVCVVLVDRANYGRLKPVMTAIQAEPRLELQVLCTGTMVLERFDQPARLVQTEGFRVDATAYVELEGSTPVTMAKSVGIALLEIASELKQLAPDVVFVIGDRYEALAAAIAAAYMNVPIAHMQGGEVSGSIDESARHAITKFAQFHFPSTRRAADYLVRMGERPETVLGVGCPSSDIARALDRKLEAAVLNERGGGPPIDPSKPFLLVVFHPTTTEHGGERTQMFELLGALQQLDMQSVLLWPNIDAGSDQLSKAIRIHRDRASGSRLRTLTNLSPENYLRVLSAASCAVGNSSSFVRDASFLGTPVVLVGNRQDGRETAEHVTRVPVKTAEIVQAVRAQLGHGRYAPSSLYGDGFVSERVARALAELEPYVQKRLHYVHG